MRIIYKKPLSWLGRGYTHQPNGRVVDIHDQDYVLPSYTWRSKTINIYSPNPIWDDSNSPKLKQIVGFGENLFF